MIVRGPNGPYTPYVPQDFGEIWDQLGSMMISPPTFVDKFGTFPWRNIDTEFWSLTESFKVVRKQLGEERYARLVELADRAKAHFAADPEDKTEDALEGRRLLTEMEDVIRDARSRRKRPAADQASSV